MITYHRKASLVSSLNSKGDTMCSYNYGLDICGTPVSVWSSTLGLMRDGLDELVKSLFAGTRMG